MGAAAGWLPIYHRKQDSIEAHLSIVFAAMAIAHWIEQTTGWFAHTNTSTLDDGRSDGLADVPEEVDERHARAADHRSAAGDEDANLPA